MQTIKKLFLYGIIGLSLMTTASCNDDDDDNAVVYQKQVYVGAYSLKDARNYTASVTNEVFSRDNIDTADFIPFVNSCRYFNDTYLSYKNEAGEVPFANIVNNLKAMVGGDMSGLPAVLDKLNAISGTYTADASTKTWKMKRKGTSDLNLQFLDQYGDTMKVSLSWYTNSYSLNVIKIKDGNGNIVSDTIPSVLQFTIAGGNDGILLHSEIACNVISQRSLEVTTSTYYGRNVIYNQVLSADTKIPYTINTHSTIFDNSMTSNATFSKDGNQLISVIKKTTGENLIKAIADRDAYPLKLDKSYTNLLVMDKMLFLKTENSALLQEKLKSIKAAGYKLYSEEFVKAYCSALSEAGETVVSNPQNNMFIYRISLQPYYDTKNSIWTTMPYLVLNDNTSYSALEFDKSGVASSGLVKMQELYSRLTAFINGVE